MATAAVFGCTGAVGSQILATLLATDTFASVKTISRRLPSAQSPKLEAIKEEDTTQWGARLASLSPVPTTVFNAVGTTRAAAGGIENQRKIDHDLCVENAKAAKAAGVKNYVFISSAGTRGFLSGYVPYSQMKVGVEDAVKEAGFDTAIILRPGMILGREVAKAPMFEALVNNMNKLGQGVQDKLGIGLPPPFRLWKCMLGALEILCADSFFLCRAGPDRHWEGCCRGCAHRGGGQGAVEVLGSGAGGHCEAWSDRVEGVRGQPRETWLRPRRWEGTKVISAAVHGPYPSLRLFCFFSPTHVSYSVRFPISVSRALPNILQCQIGSCPS